MNKKMIASLIIATLVMSSTVYGATEKVTYSKETSQATSSKDATDSNQTQNDQTSEEVAEEETVRVLQLDEAIDYAIKNSVALQQVKTKADIAKLVSNNAPNTRDDLIDADSQLSSAPYQLDNAQDTIVKGEQDLDSAQSAYKQDLMPISVESLGIKKGETSIAKAVVIIDGAAASMGVPGEMLLVQQMGATPKGSTEATLRNLIEQSIGENASKLESGKNQLAEKTREYYTSTAKYQAALSYAMSSVSSKLSTSTISSLDPRPIGELIIKMADTQDRVTSYAVNIYKNKIALLVQNSYYEALKHQKLLEVKEKAVERGKLQYDLAEAAYQVGAKSKDDMIIAKTYYDSTIMSAELERKDYEAALIELKKNMNMDLGEEIKVAEVEMSPQDNFNLNNGIISGKKGRLEVRMAEAQVDLYKYLKTALSDSNYSTSSNQYREAELLQKQAEIELQATLVEVESSIRTSYATLESMKKVALQAEELKKGAEETLEIAKVKYEVGFGYDNSLLASMNLEGMSGTMVEVLAAEENLVNIQEKAIEAMNGYNLIRAKYLNDIGVLPY